MASETSERNKWWREFTADAERQKNNTVSSASFLAGKYEQEIIDLSSEVERLKGENERIRSAEEFTYQHTRKERDSLQARVERLTRALSESEIRREVEVGNREAVGRELERVKKERDELAVDNRLLRDGLKELSERDELAKRPGIWIPGYEFTGEYRAPKEGEWFLAASGTARFSKGSYEHITRHILRRVEPPQPETGVDCGALPVFVKTVDGKPPTDEQLEALAKMAGEYRTVKTPFTRLLKALRMRSGRGLREFAERCGMLPSRFAEIQYGRLDPTDDDIANIVDALLPQPEAQQQSGAPVVCRTCDGMKQLLADIVNHIDGDALELHSDEQDLMPRVRAFASRVPAPLESGEPESEEKSAVRIVGIGSSTRPGEWKLRAVCASKAMAGCCCTSNNCFVVEVPLDEVFSWERLGRAEWAFGGPTSPPASQPETQQQSGACDISISFDPKPDAPGSPDSAEGALALRVAGDAKKTKCFATHIKARMEKDPELAAQVQAARDEISAEVDDWSRQCEDAIAKIANLFGATVCDPLGFVEAVKGVIAERDSLRKLAKDIFESPASHEPQSAEPEWPKYYERVGGFFPSNDSRTAAFVRVDSPSDKHWITVYVDGDEADEVSVPCRENQAEELVQRGSWRRLSRAEALSRLTPEGRQRQGEGEAHRPLRGPFARAVKSDDVKRFYVARDTSGHRVRCEVRNIDGGVALFEPAFREMAERVALFLGGKVEFNGTWHEVEALVRDHEAMEVLRSRGNDDVRWHAT